MGAGKRPKVIRSSGHPNVELATRKQQAITSPLMRTGPEATNGAGPYVLNTERTQLRCGGSLPPLHKRQQHTTEPQHTWKDTGSLDETSPTLTCRPCEGREGT